jgi:sulfonate dioxygenase
MAEEPVIMYDINVPYLDGGSEKIKHPQYAPTWDKVWYDPLPPFDFVDPALRADKQKPNLLSPSVLAEEITPKMGTILRNVQLTELSDQAKDELALLVSERKIVVFPDQDLIEAGPAVQQAFMNYFGKPNYQPVSGSIPGLFFLAPALTPSNKLARLSRIPYYSPRRQQGRARRLL